MHRTLSLAPLLLAAACSSAPVKPAPPTDAAAEPSTRYREGDYVVYRYSGLFTEQPVELREEVVSQRGNRLEIEVISRRGEEQRHWVQVVTDTPENQRANRIDELHEVVAGERVRLLNEGNKDLFRLYAWTWFEPDGEPRDHSRKACEQTLGGQPFACSCHASTAPWHGRTVELLFGTCPEFLWTHGEALAVDGESGEEVLRVEVLEHGHRN